MVDSIENLQGSRYLLLETLAGSHAYGLNTAHSDIDLRGVFFQPLHQMLGLRPVEQIADSKNDTVFYELGRFMDLLVKNNPTTLELLFSPTECIRFRHPVMDLIRPAHVLSKRCRNSFAGYAMAQIQKARGLNKKVLNPMDAERKGVLDFCYILDGQMAIPVQTWLAARSWNQDQCGLVAMDHARDTFALFHDECQNGTLGFKGMVQSNDANGISLSSVPKGMKPVAHLVFNKDAYTLHCKDFREYWDWVEKRNDNRYANTISHGKNYDAKNMMHTFRLLAMAEEIAREHTIHVKRPDREFLLEIRSGKFTYEELLQIAEEKIAGLDELFDRSDLPVEPDISEMEDTLVRMRLELYKEDFSVRHK